MTARTRHFDAWVCTDCYFAHHGQDENAGQAPPRPPLALLDGYEITDNTCSDHYVGNVEDSDGNNVTLACIHCGSDDEDSGERVFSWSRCDGCGSTLGGARHRLAIWES